MSVVAKVGGALMNFISGGAGTKVLKIADDLVDTSSERRADDATDTSGARAMQAQGHTAHLVRLYQINTSPLLGGVILFLILLDVLVDSVSRLVRPWVTIHLVGGLFGYWDLPSTKGIDPFWQTFAIIVLTFWFGGRFIIKDIIPLVKHIRKMQG